MGIHLTVDPLTRALGRYLKRVFIDNLRRSEPKEKREIDLSKCLDLDEYEERLRAVCESLRKENHLLKFETSRHMESIHFTISFHI